MATARYQSGSITLKKRAKGLDVWEFRWRDDGGKQRSKLLGTTAQYTTEKAAHCAADAFRIEINSELPKAVSHHRRRASWTLPER
jgi:integrase